MLGPRKILSNKRSRLVVNGLPRVFAGDDFFFPGPLVQGCPLA